MTLSKRKSRIPVRRADDPATEPVAVDEVETPNPTSPDAEAEVDWRDKALRLRAEMDNYRKRQQRLAEERVAMEKARVLRRFLVIVDDLERAIAHTEPQDPHRGNLSAIRDKLRKVLRDENVEPIPALGEAFDPNVHEAVAWVPARGSHAEAMEVVSVERAGYRLGERVLRPAQVVVAKA